MSVKFIDTHNRRRTPSTCDAVAVFTRTDGRQYVCPVYLKGHFSLNPFSLKGEQLFLRAGSVGPCLTPAQAKQLIFTGKLDLSGGTLETVTETEARGLLGLQARIKAALKAKDSNTVNVLS